jgi:HD-GYP domain-containing protein (c-di-GMP phosphodiesterase class II)
MYVTELDRPWADTPFLVSGFRIRSREDIEALQRHCHFVYVEVAESLGSAGAPSARRPVAANSAAVRVEQDLLKITNHPGARSPYTDQTTLEEELEAIGATYGAARVQVNSVFASLRRGRTIDTPAIKRTVESMVESVLRNPDALMCLAQLKQRDDYLVEHSLRACVLALALGRQLGLDDSDLHALGIGALLHDVGMVKLPDALLKKAGALDGRERALLEQHVSWGVEILQQLPGVPIAALEVVAGHHERHDGTGYMNGAKGEEIGLFAAIGALVDCYDALVSERPYHASVPPQAALKQIYAWRDRQFPAELAERFIQCMGIYPIGSLVELSSGDIGVVVTVNRVQRLKPRVALVLRSNYQPYPHGQIVDLTSFRTPEGRGCEVEQVLDPLVRGIDPARYLPLPRGQAQIA